MAAEIVEALREVVLFRGLEPDTLSALAARAERRRYSRHALIFSQGEPADGLYVVLEGQVGISRQSMHGDELLLVVCERGDYFGELALFDPAPRSANAVAQDECTVLFLGRAAFQAFLATHPAVVAACLAALVRQLRRLTDVADEIALLDVPSRLARRLLRLDAGGGAGARAAIKVTQDQLASMTGTTRESVNKHLHVFEQEGLIRRARGRVQVLDRAGLRARAQDPD